MLPEVVGPLFVFKDSTLLTREKLVIAVQSALRQAGSGGNVSHFTGNSFRIGTAMYASPDWHSGFYYQNVRTMGVCSISAVYSDPQRDSSSNIRGAGSSSLGISVCISVREFVSWLCLGEYRWLNGVYYLGWRGQCGIQPYHITIISRGS